MKAPLSIWVIIAALVFFAIWAFIATQLAESAELPADPCQRIEAALLAEERMTG